MEEPACYPCPCKLCREYFEFDRCVDRHDEDSDCYDEDLVKSVWLDDCNDCKSVGQTTSGLSSVMSSPSVSSPAFVSSPVFSPVVSRPVSSLIVQAPPVLPSPIVQAPLCQAQAASSPFVFQAPLFRPIVWIAVPVLLFTPFGFLLLFSPVLVGIA